jgi:uncharacterized protein (TIGR02246 family)
MRRICSCALLLCLAASPVLADAAADARAHSDAFARAFNAHDAKAMLALYADDARVVWPGQGDEGQGKAAIAKLIDGLLKAFPNSKLTLKTQDAVDLGNGYIATLGHWEQSFTTPDGQAATAQVRTTEIIRKRGGRTLYVIDHASIGLPPAPAPTR